MGGTGDRLFDAIHRDQRSTRLGERLRERDAWDVVNGPGDFWTDLLPIREIQPSLFEGAHESYQRLLRHGTPADNAVLVVVEELLEKVPFYSALVLDPESGEIMLRLRDYCPSLNQALEHEHRGVALEKKPRVGYNHEHQVAYMVFPVSLLGQDIAVLSVQGKDFLYTHALAGKSTAVLLSSIERNRNSRFGMQVPALEGLALSNLCAGTRPSNLIGKAIRLFRKLLEEDAHPLMKAYVSACMNEAAEATQSEFAGHVFLTLEGVVARADMLPTQVIPQAVSIGEAVNCYLADLETKRRAMDFYQRRFQGVPPSVFNAPSDSDAQA